MRAPAYASLCGCARICLTVLSARTSEESLHMNAYFHDPSCKSTNERIQTMADRVIVGSAAHMGLLDGARPDGGGEDAAAPEKKWNQRQQHRQVKRVRVPSHIVRTPKLPTREMNQHNAI
jgi:hypothetical protein